MEIMNTITRRLKVVKLDDLIPEDLKIHAVLYAFARAKSRSFLYDNYIDGEEEEVINEDSE